MPTDPKTGVRLPPYNPPPKFETEKGHDNMYPFTGLDFSVPDIEERYHGVMKPLTIFAPFPHEDEPVEDIVKPRGSDLPINDQVKVAPTTLKSLSNLVKQRITARTSAQHLSTDDQKELAAIIMGEINGIWTDFRNQIEDPFLTAVENKELLRRIAVHIVTVCEQLFLHYLQKALILQKRGVFSGPANMSRLKAQLALDANKFLNILTIRRYIIADMRGERDDDGSTCGPEYAIRPVDKKTYIPDQPTSVLSYKALIDVSRPKSRNRRYKYPNPEQDIKHMRQQMPNLDPTRINRVLTDLPDPRCDSMLSLSDVSSLPKKWDRAKHRDERRTSEDESRCKVLLNRSKSSEQLYHGETLLEELGIELDAVRCRGSTDIDNGLIKCRAKQKDKDEAAGPAVGSREYASEDLHRLMSRDKDGETKDKDEEMPPLLQAVTRSAKHDGKEEMLNQKLKELDEEEARRREEESITIHPPTHMQPATVSIKLPNKMVVRTSDIRVSDRVCMSSITLDEHATVYNDLVDEIDAEKVKELDSNLFLGNEITEVYKEIMKTVHTDHLLLENDEMVEPTADTLDLTSILASSTLTGPKEDRIINSDIHREVNPPWGEMDQRDWAKTPSNPPLDNKGRPLMNSMTPRGEGEAMKDLLGSRASEFIPPEQKPNLVNEVMARSYASWLAWWKNTLNTDDYMKYISTQESDYMGVLFHLYNSEDEDEDEMQSKLSSRTRRRMRQQATQTEKEKRMEEVRSAKSEFRGGFWNASSVLLGGLGKDPEEEQEKDTPVKSPTTQDTGPSHTPQSRNLVVSRKSQKTLLQIDESHEESSLTRDTSRVSGRAPSKHTAHSYLKSRLSGQSPSVKSEEASGSAKEAQKQLTPQDRLERVWSSLQMPDGLKLDMAIKYSSDTHHARLEEAIEEWEASTQLILQREAMVAKLENFERVASDPNRFFEKGYRGSSVARLEEAKIRSNYYKKIESLEEELKQSLEYIRKEFQDTVTFQGRPYTDKIQWDRTEMLYWLQEERKQQALQYEAAARSATRALQSITGSNVGVPLPMSLHTPQLDPIVASPVK